jgi:hypothetical protein
MAPPSAASNSLRSDAAHRIALPIRQGLTLLKQHRATLLKLNYKTVSTVQNAAIMPKGLRFTNDVQPVRDGPGSDSFRIGKPGVT